MKTIEELKTLQRERHLGDVHIIALEDGAFAIAHTDAERASGMDLHDCDLHQRLLQERPYPVSPGVYAAYEHVPDALSEPYGADPWELENLEVE